MPIERFDEYPAGTELNTRNGGSGWAGAWTADLATHKSIEVSPAGGAGGGAVRAQTTTENHYYRAFAALSVGLISWRMRISITNPNDFMGVDLRTAAPPGNGKMFVRFGPTGNIEISNNGVYVPIVPYLVDTWYLCELEFDNLAQPGKYRARIGGGSWTAWNDVDGASLTTVSILDLDTSATNAHVMWYDDIRVNCPKPGIFSQPMRPRVFAPGLAR